MTHKPFTMSVRIPGNSSIDLRVRVALALAEAALDRLVVHEQRAFELSLIDSEAPTEHLADLLWQYEHALECCAEALANLRAELSASLKRP
jgi:hypothetical protein